MAVWPGFRAKHQTTFPGSVDPCPFHSGDASSSSRPPLLAQPAARRGKTQTKSLNSIPNGRRPGSLPWCGFVLPLQAKPSCLAHRKAPSASLMETKPAAPASPALCISQSSPMQQEKQLYFDTKLSKAHSPPPFYPCIHGQDSNLEPGPGSPTAMQLCPTKARSSTCTDLP